MSATPTPGGMSLPQPSEREEGWKTVLLEMIEDYGRERNNAGISLGNYDKHGSRQAESEAEDTLSLIRAHIDARPLKQNSGDGK